MVNDYSPIQWKDEKLLLLDQRRLPQEEVFVEINDLQGTILAIKDMVVRGAPCIGFTGIYGIALWIKSQNSLGMTNSRHACDELIAARPTAVNLAFEVNRCFVLMSQLISEGYSKSEIYKAIVNLGHQQIQESE